MSELPSRWKTVFLLARPRQWTKNAIVLAAFLFAQGDPSLRLTERSWIVAVAAALLFCLVSSGIYAINDVRDARQDRQHPAKRNRPVAAGNLSAAEAVAWGLLWILTGWGAAAALDLQFAGVLGAYILLQLAYTFAWKQIALLDVFVIAAGFVLRAIAGAYVLHVPLSPWLLLCTLQLALFLALCKRRGERVCNSFAGEGQLPSRDTMEHYDIRLLDQLIAMTGSATIVCYSLYTQWPDTVAKFNTTRLGLTIPFVLFGCFRYLDLVYREQQGERPEQTLLTDPPLLITIALYAVTVFAVFATSGVAHP